MNKLFDTVLQTLRDRMPNLSWKVGSLVRELLVEPLTYIGTSVDRVIADIQKTENISEALADPVNNEDTLDVWMKRLRIGVSAVRKSTGTVTITFSGTDTLIIPESTEFSWGDSVRVFSIGYMEVSPLNGTVTRLGGDCYSINIPVETTDTTGYTLSIGTKLNWSSAPARVLDIYVSSTVTGGSTGLSANEKARLIDAHLGNAAICGEQTTLNALVREFGESVCDIRFGDRVQAAGLVTVPAYIKQSSAPQTVDIPLSESGDGSYTLPADQVVTVAEVTDSLGNVRQFTADYSSSDNIQINVVGSPASKLTASTIKYTETAAIADWLNARQRGVAAVFKAATPIYCEIGVRIPYIGELPEAATAAVSEYINHVGFDAVLKDSDIVTILGTYGVIPNGALNYSAEVKHRNISRLLSQVGGINLSTVLGTSGEPVAVYCPINKVITV